MVNIGIGIKLPPFVPKFPMLFHFFQSTQCHAQGIQVKGIESLANSIPLTFLLITFDPLTQYL